MDIGATILYIFIFCSLYIQLFLLITFFESEDSDLKKPADLPTVSITVPCFNEGKTLAKTMNSLFALNYPKEKLHFFIVNDGSTDDTATVAETFRSDRVTVLHQKNGGKYTALNYGIKHSKAEFVGCLDADSEVHPDALKNMIPYFKGPDIVAVTPAMVVHNPQNILQLMQRVEYQIGVFAKWVYGKLDAIHVTPGPFSIFRRDVFHKIGYFRHAHNTEDMEIAFRIQSHGLKIANCPNAFVYTITPNTVKKLYKQRVRWTYGFLKNILDYKHLILNPRYGNIGMLTLPFGIISTSAAIYIFANFIIHTADFISKHVYKWSIVGFHPHFSLSFDWFYINTDLYVLLSVIVLAFSFTIILIGKKMSVGNAWPGRDMVYFSVLYGFIAPLWVSKALYNALLAKKTPWR